MSRNTFTTVIKNKYNKGICNIYVIIVSLLILEKYEVSDLRGLHTSNIFTAVGYTDDKNPLQSQHFDSRETVLVCFCDWIQMYPSPFFLMLFFSIFR